MKKNDMVKKLTKTTLLSLFILTFNILSPETYGTQYPETYGKPTDVIESPKPHETNNQGEVVDLHGKVKQLNNEALCEPTQWGNNQGDACRCSLIFNKNKFGSTKSANDIVLYTINTTKRCNQTLISKIKTEQGLKANASSQELIDSLFNKDIVIQKINFDKSLLSPTGTFTEKSLPIFLSQAFREKKLKNKDFSKEECLTAKNLGTQGGYNTLQLFLVTSTCDHTPASMYIVKEARNGLDEAINLKTIEEYPGMKDIIAPKVSKGLPSIALPLAYFSYPLQTTVHYIAAMPAAKGKVLNNIIIEFRDNQSAKNKDVVERAFKILGMETANFHKKFMKPKPGKILGVTIAHGDFHFFNLFFDELGAHFTFIDNETMAKYLNNLTSPSVDLVKLFFMPFSINSSYQQFHDLIKGIDLKTWFDVTLKNFVEKYISVYKPADKKQLLQELKTMFNEPFTIPWVDFDDNQLQKIRNEYINPIFDALMQ